MRKEQVKQARALWAFTIIPNIAISVEINRVRFYYQITAF